MRGVTVRGMRDDGGERCECERCERLTTEATEEEEEKDADAELKMRTPHRDVGFSLKQTLGVCRRLSVIHWPMLGRRL